MFREGKVEQRFKFCHNPTHALHGSHCVGRQNLGVCEGFDLVTSICGTQTRKVYNSLAWSKISVFQSVAALGFSQPKLALGWWIAHLILLMVSFLQPFGCSQLHWGQWWPLPPVHTECVLVFFLGEPDPTPGGQRPVLNNVSIFGTQWELSKCLWMPIKMDHGKEETSGIPCMERKLSRDRK